ncbi:e3 ubiquitin-protein ligase uhrf2 [Lasius niger]|uniref:E3 ubiquitin-protein ligase uhrf2 n=1 Tax=Lasius niger TaxID=67767 RepID=A0A0J7L9H6_LASNI|nr:e3 ubiquitin-protein ligase uhrf2 [Lasius niger]
MARASNDVSRIVCANIIQENEKRLLEARIKNQGKGRTRQDLNKLFSKLNQAAGTNLAKTSEKLNLTCYNTSVISNCWYGPVLGFPPGSWWGIRMDCSRDHMHDPFDIDTHEGAFGVVSVCTSHTNMNEDVDLGDFLTLTGQVYREEQPDTDPLIHNYKNQIPLRLIRSYNLQNDIAPNTGYRYDGLYIVIGCWIGAASNGIKYNKFALMRLADQEPPSWSSANSEDVFSARQCVPLSKSNHSNAYDLRKCSYNTSGICGKRKLSHRDDLPAAKVDVGRKNVHESSIVTRHVFKKPSSNAENAISTIVSDQKTLTCLGASAAKKTHSTNISIRMGLYESSHNAQDAKKNVSTMLHKPSKSIDIAIRTALDMESVRSTSKEDNKLVTRLDTDKALDNPQPGENVPCNGYIVAEKANEVVCPLKKRRRNLQVLNSSEHSHTPVLSSSSLNSLDNDTNIIERKEQLENVQQHSDSQNLNLNNEPDIQISNPSNESIPRNSVTTHEMIPKHNDTLEISNESLCAQSIKSLDSLTPDKILNLINKEKHHPLSKLLIGNVIGLTTEECAMLERSKMPTLDSKSKVHISSKVNLKSRRKKGDNIKENVACLDNRRYCKYSKSKRLSWKVQSESAGKFDKTLPGVDRQSCKDQKCNNNARKSDQSGISKKNNEYLSPFRVQTSLPTIAHHTRSSYDIKTRLRTDKSAVGSMKQEFPDSSIKKNRYKKRDREIANLSIDANFSPVTRGPRNRRLRCKNNTYANKRCCSTFNTVIYPPSKRCKSSFKRKSKLTKVKRAGDGRTKNRYGISNALRTNAKDIDDSMERQKNFESTADNDGASKDYNRNNVGKRKENRVVTLDADDRNISKVTFDRSLRKKLTRTIPLSHHSAQTAPLLHYFHKKQVQKPSTMDATTQCRLISENPEVYVIGQLNDQRAILKMEWDKYEKLRSESMSGDVADDDDDDDDDDRGYQVCQTSRPSCGASTFTKRSVDRTSAFVPVTNAFDSNLRIARLRSIGFKPIIKPRSPLVVAYDSELDQNSTSKVTKRDVAERYDKYANSEDDNAVVYMDDELQYQDIEEEEEEEEEDDEDATSMKSGASSRNDDAEMSRENVESPWHGWKKIVTNNRSYWIGW